MSKVEFGKIEAKSLTLNPIEVAARLNTARGYTDEQIESCLAELLNAADCKYAFVRTPIIRDGGKLNLGFGEFESKDLSKNLTGCDEAFVFAVTTGMAVDRLILKQSLMSESKLFITDGLASALAEATCDEAEKIIKGSLNCRPRFSPGFGDMHLSIQPKLLEFISAKTLLGISINDSLLMTPTKSITAIMGIKNEQV